jgi:gliding motility-associated-like protein
VVLDSLPSSGTWILTRSPDGTILTGTGTITTITGLQPGSYTFTVTGETGCNSLPSGEIVINPVPATPAPPTIGTITAPTCSVVTGSVVLEGLPSIGTWMLTRYPDSTTATGSGVSVTLSGIASGTYNYTVTNSEGCISEPSPDIVIPEQIGKLMPPVIDTINQPDCLTPTGSVVLTGLPSSGTWTLTRTPGDVLSSGTGPGATISELSPGTYSFTVSDSAGCISASSENIVINEQPVIPGAPSVGTIIAPTCTVATGSVSLGSLPPEGTWMVTRYPDLITATGTGTSTTIEDIIAGTYYFTVTNGDGCVSVKTDDVVIPLQPGDIRPPEVGEIIHPGCNVSTGSVTLNSLPVSGTWVLTRFPGGIITTGSGGYTTITGLLPGSYTFTVTNSVGCNSSPSPTITINEQPDIPDEPVIGNITSPTCVLATGSVIINNLPSTGTWSLTRYPGTITTLGTGTSANIMGLAPGTYNFTVTNNFNCISAPSSNVVIPQQPPTPTEPLLGEITQLVYPLTAGSIILYGLPTTEPWILTRSPDGVIVTGSGASTKINDVPPGEYTFSVSNSSGCSSEESEKVIILDVIKPVVNITDPDPVCYPETVDLSAPGITEGSTSDLTFTYWTDDKAVNSFDTPYSAVGGKYFIKGTNQSGFFDIKPVTVTVVYPPVANAGPDQILEYEFSTTLSAELNETETGKWTLLSGACEFYDMTDAKTKVTNLSEGDNLLLWTVTNGVCSPSQDSVNIKVNDLVIPTLITPNMDGINDYFILRGLENLGRTSLTIFDRRGKMVYKNDNYDNLWNGIDINNSLLPDDTYFYLLKAENGRSLSGYIIIRK